MATKPPPVLTFADKLKALEAKAALDKAAKDAFLSHVARGEAAFELKHGKSPKAYVRTAVLAAYAKTSKAGGFAGRSVEGKSHAQAPGQVKEMAGAILAYHQMEESAKACAQAGDIVGSIDGYDKAAQMRIAYETSHNKTPDAGHTRHRQMLLQRRDSLVGLKGRLDKSDPDVTAAKLLVTNFFGAGGVIYSV